jgi:hypothetical protein
MINRILCLALTIFVASCDMQGSSSKGGNIGSTNDQSPKLAEIGKHTITKQALTLELDALPGGEARASRPGGHRAELERLIDLMVAEEEGAARKINDDPVFQQRLAQIKTKARHEERELMYEMLYQKFVESSTISDDQINAYYEKHKNRFLTSRIHLRRISTKSKGEIEAAQKRLDKGEPFEKVAAVFNMDEKLRESGGDMGPMLRNDLPASIHVAAFRLQKENEISPPFESGGGWNILQLIKKESGVTRPLEDVKDQLVRELKRTQAKKMLVKTIKDRRKKLGVTIYEDQVAKLGPPMIESGARPTKSAPQLNVPESYQSRTQQPKQVESSLEKHAGGH